MPPLSSTLRAWAWPLYLRCFSCSADLKAPSVPPRAIAVAHFPSTVRTSIIQRSRPPGPRHNDVHSGFFHSSVVSSLVQFGDHDFFLRIQSRLSAKVGNTVADRVVNTCTCACSPASSMRESNQSCPTAFPHSCPLRAPDCGASAQMLPGVTRGKLSRLRKAC